MVKNDQTHLVSDTATESAKAPHNISWEDYKMAKRPKIIFEITKKKLRLTENKDFRKGPVIP